MTTIERDAILDLILDEAGAIPHGDDDRPEAIREAARRFCRAFPAEAEAYALASEMDYATRDRECPPAPWPTVPPPSGRVDEPIGVAF